MDITLNERLKQYQRHYYTSKKKTKIKCLFFAQFKMSEKH